MTRNRFAGLLRDNLHLRVLLGLEPPPDEAASAAAVEDAVDIFMHGVTIPH